MGAIRVQLSPPLYDVETKPNALLTYQISIQNNGTDQLLILAYVKNLMFDLDGNPSFNDAPFQKHSCQSWIDVQPKSLLLPPMKNRMVDVTIKVPENVSGGYYAAILFETDTPQKSLVRSTVGLQLRTGSLVSLKIKRTQKIDAKISLFQLYHRKNQTEFQIILKNDGNCHINPRGSIVIFDEQNRIVDRINMNDSAFTLPHSERRLKVIWKNERKRVAGKSYLAECRFLVKGLGKSLSYKSQPFYL